MRRFALLVRAVLLLAAACTAQSPAKVSAAAGSGPAQVPASAHPEVCVVWALPDGTDYSHCMEAPRQLHGLPLVDEYGMPVGHHAVRVELRGGGEGRTPSEPLAVASAAPLHFEVTPPVVAPKLSDSNPVPAPGTDPAAYARVAILTVDGEEITAEVEYAPL